MTKPARKDVRAVPGGSSPARVAACRTRVFTESGLSGRTAAWLLLPTGPQHGSLVDAGEFAPALQGANGAAVGVRGAGEDHELDVLADLVGLRPGQGEHEPVGVVGEVVDGEGGQLAAPQRRDETDQQQRTVPRAGQVRLRKTAAASPQSW